MLSLTTRSRTILFTGLIASIFVGCSSKNTYNWGEYTDPGVYSLSKKKGVDRSGIHVPEQQMKNSAAMHRATMRPYQIFGKWYYPTTAKVGDVFTGVSSWYGPKFHAKPTSNGEIYDMFKRTAAHKTLPMNTMVRVENLENGKVTIVRINDRGPFVGNRIIDLSNKAAREIDMVAKGTAKVKVTVLGFNGKIATSAKEKKEVASVDKYFLQIGAFSKYEGAQSTKDKFSMLIDSRYNVQIKEGLSNGKVIHRVWIGGFRSEDEIKDFKTKNDLTGTIVIAD